MEQNNDTNTKQTEKGLYVRENLSKSLKECPDEPKSSKDYKKMPVENFGLSMLKKMGLEKEMKVGKTNFSRTKVSSLSKRPNRLGLGSGEFLPKKPLTGNFSKKRKFGKQKNKNSDNTEKCAISKPKTELSGFDKTKRKKFEWVKRDLVVRIVDKEYKNLYLEKGMVVDVLSPFQLLLRILRNGELIDSFLIEIFQKAFDLL